MSASDSKVGIFPAAGPKKERFFFLQSPARGKMGYEAGFGGKRLFVRLFHLFMDGRLCPEMPPVICN